MNAYLKAAAIALAAFAVVAIVQSKVPIPVLGPFLPGGNGKA
jgi:hypothetical protein